MVLKMSEFTLPSSNICLTATKTVQKITKPFFDATGFNFFSYARDFSCNKSFSIQTNNDLFLAQFENKSAYCSSHVPEGVYVWNDIQNDSLVQEIQALGHENGIYIFKHHATFSEIFALSAPKRAFNHLQFYINNQDLINKFFFYFKEQAARTIKQAMEEPLILPDYMTSRPIKNVNQFVGDLDSLSDSLAIKRFYFNDSFDGIKLSKREIECLGHYLKGKATSDIATILNLKKVTIDTFMRNIKKKFNCQTRSQLYEIFWKLDIFKTNGVFN
jgi:DNA-binding CsgD family transcriptional regulator